MEIMDLNQLMTNLPELVEIVSSGTEIIITKNEQPVIKLTSISQNDQELLSVSKIQELIKKTAENHSKLTTKERTQKWLDLVESMPSNSANLPESALHRDTMYD